MTAHPLVEALLAANSVREAREVVRVSRYAPVDVGNLLASFANELLDESPATAAAAGFLAQHIWALDEPQPWVHHEDLPPAVNAALRSAASSGSWIKALSALRPVRPELTERTMIAVTAWHSTLAGAGFPPGANGASVVIVLGALLGGRARVMAGLVWARSVESRSVDVAERHLRRARGRAETGGWVDLVAWSDSAVNGLRARFGRPVERRDHQPVGEVTPVMLPILEARAADLLETGDAPAALAVLDRIVPITAELRDAVRLVRLLNLRGLTLDGLGSFDRASDDFRESARLAAEVEDGPRRFEALTNLAAGYLKRGQPLRALPPFRALMYDADIEGSLGRRIAARNNLAAALADSGRLAESRDLYLDAWRLIAGRRDFGSYWITSMGLASVHKQLDEAEQVHEVGNRLWRLWIDERDSQALETYLLSAACDLTIPEVLDVAEQWNAAWTDHGDLFRAGHMTRALARHERQQGHHERALKRLDLLLAKFASVRSSSVVCIGAEREAAAIESQGLAAPTAAIARLRSAVAATERRLLTIDTAPDRDWVLDAAKPMYLDLIDLLLDVGTAGASAEAYWLHEAARPATLTTGAQEYSELWTDSGIGGRVAGADEVRRALELGADPSVVVVSFLETGSRFGAFVLKSDDSEPAWVPLPVTAVELEAAAVGLSLAFNGDASRFPPRRPVAARDLDAVDLAELEHVLCALGEVTDRFEVPEVVVLVPSPSMEGLPMAAIASPAGRRLAELAAVVVQPSLSALVITARRSIRVNGTSAVFVAGVASSEDAHPERFEGDAVLFEGLALPTDAVYGVEATASAVLAGLRQASVAHLSFHGFVDAVDPLGSGLLVSDGTRRPTLRSQSVPVLERRRFELTVRDLSVESLDLDVVTLRACSTARRAAIAAKEENSTLMRALQVAGCRVVVSTLWNVDQQSSLELFSRFYARHLEDGLPAALAMATSQREMIAAGSPHSHLYHWGPYTVSGDWRAGP